MVRKQFVGGLAAVTGMFLVSACDNADTLSAPRTTAPRNATVPSVIDSLSATGPGPLLSAVAANVCADVWGASKAPGAALLAFACHGGANQMFTLQASGAITAYDGALCLDVTGGAAKDGDAVITYTCHGGANQRWTRTAASELRTAVNGKCLDVPDGRMGMKLIVYTCNGGANQKWTVRDAGVVAAAPEPTPLAPPVAVPSTPTSTTGATAASVAVTPIAPTLAVGSTVQLTAAPRDAGGAALTGRTALWSSANPNVATVSTTGLVTAVAAGAAAVTATIDGAQQPVTVTVQAPAAAPAPAPAPLPTTPGPIAALNPTSGVVINPGDDWNAKIRAYPPGTAFWIKAGVHQIRSTITPKSGQSFVGEVGAIVDGGGVTYYGIDKGPAPFANNVTVRNLVFQRFPGPRPWAAINPGGSTHDGATGWVIEHNEIKDSDTGIRTCDGCMIRYNAIHHNTWMGLSGVASRAVIEANEIAYNGLTGTNPDRCGAKIVLSDGTLFRGNYVHGNGGAAGLWTDIANINITYDGNRIEDNAGAGIFHEVSYSARIVNNVIRGNGYGSGISWVTGAGILVAASPDVEVTGNALDDNRQGIAVTQQNRPMSENPTIDGRPHELKNVVVRANTVRMTPRGQYAAVLATDAGWPSTVFTSAGNSWTGNSYRVPATAARPFNWLSGDRTWTEWRGAYGHDAAGTFATY